MTDPAHKGTSSSEFYATIGGLVAAIAVSGGVISAEQQNALAEAVVLVLVGLGGVGAIFGMVRAYVNGRNNLKMKMLETRTSVGQISE